MLRQNYLRMIPEDRRGIDDLTWLDLGLSDQCMRMDRTFTNAGSQNLYNMLRSPVFDEDELCRRDDIISWLGRDQEGREKVQCLLSHLGRKLYDSAAECLYGEMPELPKIRLLIYPLSIGMLASVLSIPFWGLASSLPIIMFVIFNITLHFVLRERTEKAMPGVRSLAEMLLTIKRIGRLKFPELDSYNTFFEEALEQCGGILWRMKTYGAAYAADPLGIMIILQTIFLSEERTYLGCANLIRENIDILRKVYEKLGELDAFQSVASYRRTLSPLCRPSFEKTEKYLSVRQIGHPALENAVCNDITLAGKSLVLTGSNMSGKSTFLRTIGINAVLAQTFYMVKAEEYRAGFFAISTSISPSDDLKAGKSYYMVEAQALLRMLPLTEMEYPALLIIDEIFRGTNPSERVASASALLSYLSKRNCLIIVATHDIEITKSVENQYLSCHFEEKVTKNSLDFDYILRPGVLKKPNGIHILEYIGYPEEITSAALAAVESTMQE